MKYLIDVSDYQGDAVMSHLLKFKLRNKVSITNVSNDYKVWSVMAPSNESFENVKESLLDKTYGSILPGTSVFVDPRVPELGIQFSSPL